MKNNDDEYVDGLSAAEIESRALAWREALDIPASQWVPDVVAVIEHRLPVLFPQFSLAVSDDERMGEAEAYTQFQPPRIVVRESVYTAANVHEPRSRMTLAHELGHLVLHKGEGKGRTTSAKTQAAIKPYNSAEWQARKFAAFFLLPRFIVCQFESPDALAMNCKVSLQAANIRFAEVAHRTRTRLPDDVKRYLDGYN